MNSTTKVLIPNKEWLIKNNEIKIGSIAKDKKGYVFLKAGMRMPLNSIDELTAKFGISLFEETVKVSKYSDMYKQDDYTIYDYPCSSKPFNPLYNVQKKLPLYAKNNKSKSRYCAGYYIVQFQNGWVRSFCPKLITLERYPYRGPFKTEADMKELLNSINKV